MPKRYEDVRSFINNSELYYNTAQDRGLNFIEQYPTMLIRPISIDFKTSILKVPHVWASGDKYFSISQKYYDNIRYWWLIAWFNEKPTEQHINIGEVIYIPQPLQRVLNYYFGE